MVSSDASSVNISLNQVINVSIKGLKNRAILKTIMMCDGYQNQN